MEKMHALQSVSNTNTKQIPATKFTQIFPPLEFKSAIKGERKKIITQDINDSCQYNCSAEQI